MSPDQILADIHESNLSYLMLAQSLIRHDKEQALYRLGMSEATAEMVLALTPAQVVKLARSNTLLCQFRIDDAIFTLLSGGVTSAANDVVVRMHAAILTAGKHQEAA